MPIRVKCQCQQQFDAPDHLAGKTVKCPKCASPIRIPNPTASTRTAPTPPSLMAGLLDEVGVKQRVATGCPGCGAGYAPDAVLCVECGYNFRTGRRMETKSIAAEATDGVSDGHGVNAEFLLQKALRDQEAERVMQKKMVSFGIPWWGYLLMLIGIIAFIIGMGSLPQDLAMVIAGWILVVASQILGFTVSIWLYVIAFKDSTTQGLLVLLVPCYAIVYIFTHWDECAGPFFLYLGAVTLSTLGYGAFELSKIIGKEEGEVMLEVSKTILFAILY